MANDDAKKVGGEYGSIRANIDVALLEAYLVKTLKGFRAPVDVKQFKVRGERPSFSVFLPFYSLDRYSGVSCALYRLTVHPVQPHILPDRRQVSAPFRCNLRRC